MSRERVSHQGEGRYKRVEIDPGWYSGGSDGAPKTTGDRKVIVPEQFIHTVAWDKCMTCNHDIHDGDGAPVCEDCLEGDGICTAPEEKKIMFSGDTFDFAALTKRAIDGTRKTQQKQIEDYMKEFYKESRRPRPQNHAWYTGITS